MAYNFLDLTNEVLARFNEVELTAANFGNARGFQIQCKNAVNAAIRHINQMEFGWTFNHALATKTLTANTTRYAVPDETKYIDYDTFRLVPSTSLGNAGTKLIHIDYKEYLERYGSQEDTSGVGGVPKFVFRDPANKYGFYPYPDKAYQVKFDYYTYPDQLASATDVPTIPERFRHVIADGAVMFGFQFRGETQQYTISKDRFEEGIKNMQSVLLNRYDYVRSYYIPKGGTFTFPDGKVN